LQHLKDGRREGGCLDAALAPLPFATYTHKRARFLNAGRRAVDFDFLADEGVIDQEDRKLFWYAETAQEIWNGILTWYATGGEA